MHSTHRRYKKLAHAAAGLTEPRDYFAGRRRPVEVLPDSVLIFARTHPARLARSAVTSSFHQRWVLVVALHGSGTISLDRAPQRLKPGSALLIPPLHLHTYSRVNEELNWLFITFEWPGHTALSADWRGPRRLTATCLDQLSALLIAWQGPAGDGLDLAVPLQRLLRGLFSAKEVTTPGPAPADPLLASLRMAEESLPLGAPLAAFARRLGMAESHLRARFRTTAGLSLGRYLREARLRRAATWLREEGLSVKDAAARSGFNDIYAFSRAFKRALGVPPSSLRR